MMRVYENGVYRYATEEEEEYERNKPQVPEGEMEADAEDYETALSELGVRI